MKHFLCESCGTSYRTVKCLPCPLCGSQPDCDACEIVRPEPDDRPTLPLISSEQRASLLNRAENDEKPH